MINSKIILDSISKEGTRVLTYEVEYPRMIHSEIMTHRVFSRNAASSRAIPIEATIKMVEDSPAMPVEWGKNQAGMQAKEVFSNKGDIATCVWAWREAAKRAVVSAKELQALGLHKQIVNRVLEPFVTIKTIITTTEWDNFFNLRTHLDAQPELRVLSNLMYEQYCESTPQELSSGQWHLPYVGYNDGTYYSEETGEKYTLTDALKISSSCTAQVSYRKLDESVGKAIKIYDSLVTGEPVHASPFEHQCTPMEYSSWLDLENGWEGGVSHVSRNGDMWSGNIRGWIQYRQLIPNNVCNDFTKGDK